MDMYLKYQCMFLNPLFEFPYPQSLPSPKQTYWSQAGKKKKKKSVTLCRVTGNSNADPNN